MIHHRDVVSCDVCNPDGLSATATDGRGIYEGTWADAAGLGEWISRKVNGRKLHVCLECQNDEVAKRAKK